MDLSSTIDRKNVRDESRLFGGTGELDNPTLNYFREARELRTLSPPQGLSPIKPGSKRRAVTTTIPTQTIADISDHAAVDHINPHDQTIDRLHLKNIETLQ